MNGEITAAGIFSASAWDENFGEVVFNSLSLHSAGEVIADNPDFFTGR